MANNFDDYIKQLQGLENSENVASLKALRDMHSNVLSFFPSIVRGIDDLINSESVPQDFVNDVKGLIPELSVCRSLYEELLASEKSQSHSSAIIRLLNRKETITIHEVAQYKVEISDMLRSNEQQLEAEKKALIQDAEKEAALRKAIEEAERQRQAVAARQAFQNAQKEKEKKILHLEHEFIVSQGNISIDDACYIAENSKNKVILGRVRLKFVGNSKVIALLDKNSYAPATAASGCLHMILILIIPTTILSLLLSFV